MSEAPAEAPAPKRKRDWDAWAAVAASFAAVLALVVGAYTADLQRQQVRAQVWPRLQVARAEGRHIIAWNKGTGPARVRSVRMEVNRRLVKNWDELLVALGHEPKGYGQSQVNKTVISAGERIDAFSGKDDEAGRALFKAVFGDLRPIGIEICYCSVLDQCWRTGGGGSFGDIDDEREVDGCPPLKDEFEQ
jgi:hypothetical protein